MTEWDIRVWLYGLSGSLAAASSILLFYGIGGSLIENLFATALGSAFTIFVVDNLLRLAEKQRTLPVRVAAYDDARGLHSSCRFLWIQMLVGVLDAAPNHDADLFAQQYCWEVCQHLNLDKPAPIIPTRSWRDHLWISSGEIRKTAADYLIRYIGTAADMVLIGIIRKLERSVFLFFCSHLNVLPQAAREIGVTRPPVMGFGVEVLVIEFLSTLQELRSHLEQMGQEFRNHPGFSPVSPATFTEDLLQFTLPKLGAGRFDPPTTQKGNSR